MEPIAAQGSILPYHRRHRSSWRREMLCEIGRRAHGLPLGWVYYFKRREQIVAEGAGEVDVI